MKLQRALSLSSICLALAVNGLALPVRAEEKKVAVNDVTYTIVDGYMVPDPLTEQPGDPENGRLVFVNRQLGNCLGCHVVSELQDEAFQGEIGPSLDGVADRLEAGMMRMQVINPKVINPGTIMPAFFRTDGLHDVLDSFEGKTILSAQEVEDVIAYLGTLKE
jgi:sulfur-oxidizing protein SoxX